MLRYGIISILLMAGLSSLSGRDSDLKLKSEQELKQSCTAWLHGEKSIPVINRQIQTPQPIPIQSDELVSLSDNKEIILVQERIPAGLVLNVYDFNGNKLNDFTIDWHHDLPRPQVLINDRAGRIFIVTIDGRVACRDFDGKVLWELNLTEGMPFSYENTYFASLSGDHLIVALTFPRSETTPGFNSLIARLDAEGNIIKTISLENQMLMYFNHGPNSGQSAVVVRYTDQPRRYATRILSETGQFIYETAEPVRAVEFIDENRLLLIQKQIIRAVDINQSKILWQKTATDENAIFGKVRYAPKVGVIAASGRPVYDQGNLRFASPEIELFDISGERLQRFKLSQQQALPGIISLDNNSDEIKIDCPTQLLIIE